MKLSIGLWTLDFGFWIDGIGGLRTGFRLHQFFRLASTWLQDSPAGDAFGVDSRGSGSPIATHFSKSAITESGSLPVGGIFRRGCVWRSAWMSRLSSGLPRTTAGPD